MMKKNLHTILIVLLFLLGNLAIHAQGTESFGNTTSNSSYSSISWTGDNGVSWNATDTRTDQTITGKAICIRNGTLNFGLSAAQKSAGIGDLTINARAPFGSPPDVGTLELFVNGTSISTKTTTGATTSSIVSYTWAGINKSSLTSIEIKQTTTGKRIAIDDVVWTAYAPCTAPTTQASAISFSSVGNNSMDISWTNGNGAGQVVVMNSSNSFSAPTDGSNPSASLAWANSGQQVVFNGTGSGAISITGLSPATTYYFRIYEYCSPDRVYNTATATQNPNSQATTASSSPALLAGAISAGFGSVCVNTTAVTNPNFTISGSYLTSSALSVSGNAAYSFATTAGGTYSNPLNLGNNACGSNNCYSQTIYVKFTPVAATSYNGNITISGAGALDATTTVTGSGINGTVAVTTIAASGNQTTSVNAGGNTLSTSCGTITNKGTVWGISANPTIPSANSTNDGSGTTNYTSSVTGLTANTVYHYRAYATNSNGVTAYGSDLTFTTISFPPTSPAATTPTQDGFTASWSAPTGQGVASYTYTLEVFNNNTFNGVPITTVNSISGTSSVLSGLNSSTTYYYRVRVDNAGGSSTYANFTTGITTLAGPLWSNPITGTNPGYSNPYTTGDTKDANITVSGIGLGTGVSGAGANNRYAASGWNTTASLDTSDYFKFTLTPNSGYKIDFTNLIYTGQTSRSGPTNFALRSSVDGYTSNIGTPTATGTTISLSGAAFQTITASISFRLYGWNASSGAGTFSINDFEFNGTVSPYACAAPTTQASAITFANVLTSSMDINWTNGNGGNRVVYINSTNSFTAPTDGGSLPSANTIWANSGQQLVYNGNGNTVSISGLNANTTYYIRVYDYNCTGSSTKFITSTATSNPNSQATSVPASTASVIQAVSGSEANTISSLVNGTITDNTEGVQVWKFKLFDGDGTTNDADNLPTIYKQWTIRAAAGNTVPNWGTVINNVKFFEGASTTPISGSFIVSNSTISFTPTSGISVADGAGNFKQISMRLTLDNPMAAGSDGKLLVFELKTADVSVDLSTVSSQLNTFSQSSSSSKNEIDVIATLQFIGAPTSVPVGSNFTITVSAIDVNGNIDQNQTIPITLAKSSGAGTLTGGSTHNLVAGTYTFTGLSYNQVGTFQVSASGGSFSPVYATINSTNDPFQLFDDFNRANSNAVGIPSSGGSTAWAEIETGDGSRARVENNTLLLSNCNSNLGSSGNGLEQIQFNGTGKYATTFANAANDLTWLFNMRSSRSSPSGFSTTNTYGAAIVLGCSESDFTSATANGYAVVLGNQSTPKPVKFIYFTGGLTSNSNVTDIAVSNYTGETGYLSVKVSYNPCKSEWSLNVRNDGSSFTDPNIGSLGTAFTGTNSTYTASSLPYFGVLWQHGSSCSEILTIDNLFIPNAIAINSNTKRWLGSIDNDWGKGGNWCGGSVPIATNDVFIPTVTNSPIINTSVTINDINLANGATLNVASSGALTLNGTFSNNGAATIQNGANFLQGNSSNYSGSGTFTVEKSITNTADGYRDISSPVATTVADLADDFSVFGQNGVQCWYAYSPYPNVQVYNEALNIVNGNYYEGWLSYTGTNNTLSAMKGVAIRTYKGAPFTLDFTGVPYNGTKSVAITKTTSGTPLQDGWNFIGNPYPSNIDWVAAQSLNSGKTTGSYYVFNTTGEYTGNWGVCNSAGACSGLSGINQYITSAQGFFVQATGNSSFMLNNTVRTTSTANYYKNDLANELRLYLHNQTDGDEILFYTDEQATDNEDLGLDAVKIPAGSTVNMGFNILNKQYAITVANEITEQTVLPLTVVVKETGNYTFEIPSQNLNNLTPYLRDELTGIEKDLTQGNPVLALNSNQIYNNFSVVFKPAIASSIGTVEQHVKIWSNGNNVHISKENTTPAEICISNLLGQQILKTTTTNKSITLPLSGSEVWYAVVKVTEGTKVSVQKVLISNK